MENIDPRYYHGEKIERLCRRYPDAIRGLKLRISGEIAEFSGTTSFDALRAGFPPDIISGDLTRNTFGNLPAVSLPYLMTRFLAMGIPFADVLAAVTTKPSALLGMQSEIGCLRVGANADIAVFERRQGSFSFTDVRGVTVSGTELLVPCATLLEGEWVFNNLPYRQQNC